MIKNIKGAIFDLDGTILDSMPMWYSLYGNYLKEAGLELSDDLADFFHHATIPMAAERFSQGIIPRTKEKIEEELYATISNYYKNEPTIKADADVLIKALYQKGVKLCVATATELGHARASLEKLDLLKYFDRVFSCKELKIEKNKPDIYLLALKHLDTLLSETVVFEDAYHAVKTAKDAGLYVVAIEEKETIEDAEKVKKTADVYVKDYESIIKEL